MNLLFQNFALLTNLFHFTKVYSQELYFPNEKSSTSCYDQQGIAQRCTPEFTNVAHKRRVNATNTCGIGRPTKFCVNKALPGSRLWGHGFCNYCDARFSETAHTVDQLTDFNDPRNETWWQSETMADGVHRNNDFVNLTLSLGKSHEITYVHLKFVSSRPESFVIYKKTSSDDNYWIPWQFYSGSCHKTFGLPNQAPILPGQEMLAQCTREFSDISPLTGETITFATLENRPSSKNYAESEVLQNWATATDIRISFVRFNTFGDELFQNEKNMRYYWYGVSDLAVGGRCKCHGHASKCEDFRELQGQVKQVCRCQHNTTGIDCEQCEPFFVDRPWLPATSTEANECLPCNCNGLSQRCFFDKELFERTGHGGHCIDCAGNTSGPNCEKCLTGFWRRANNSKYCTPCQCNKIGSISDKCDSEGQCFCKPGVSGQYCDRCDDGFFDFGREGCKDCGCDSSGSFNDTQTCHPSTGNCNCKVNVEGRRCNVCKPGFFKDDLRTNSYGCTPCFCFGHSSVCSSSNEEVLSEKYYVINITSRFENDTQLWMAQSEYRSEKIEWESGALVVSQKDSFSTYFAAPYSFLGDQRFFYNQLITFWLKVVPGNSVAWSSKDIILESGCGQSLSLPLIAQKNPKPSSTIAEYKFRMHANPSNGWMDRTRNPNLKEMDFINILANLTGIKIRGTYAKNDIGFLYNFSIGSATVAPADRNSIFGTSHLANWIEHCVCPGGYMGKFCESCAIGYRREKNFGGQLSNCLKCNCNGHSTFCDPESGFCDCKHNTEGKNCELCARGWYGNALQGTPDDCKKCDCPFDGPCIHSDAGIVCTDCPEGYVGKKCEFCDDEYFGDPLNDIACQRCECSGNIDENAIKNCDPRTGECKRCIYNTAGKKCEYCAHGYWGDALSEIKGDCKPCNCYSPGTHREPDDFALLECNQDNGQCACQPNVVGVHCDKCKDGFFNITSGSGCFACHCNTEGSLDSICDQRTGQCKCKPGVVGEKCDQCAERHYGFLLNSNGCSECHCDLNGSEDSQCDIHNGQCLCKDLVVGRECDKCAENYYGLKTLGECIPCDDCYSLIEKQHTIIATSINELRHFLDDLTSSPINDTDLDGLVLDIKSQIETMKGKIIEEVQHDERTRSVEKFIEIRDQVQIAANRLSVFVKASSNIDHKINATEKRLIEFNIVKGKLKDNLWEAKMILSKAKKEKSLKKIHKSILRRTDRITPKELVRIADEATVLSEGQKRKMDEIKRLTSKIRDISLNATTGVKGAIHQATKSDVEIKKLERKVSKTSEDLSKVVELSGKISSDVQITLNNAALALAEVRETQIPPEIGLLKIKNDMETIKVKALKISEEVNEAVKAKERSVFEYQQEIANKFNTTFSEMQLEFEETRNITDRLKLLKRRAQEASNLCEQTLNKGEIVSKSVSEFERENIQKEFQQTFKNVTSIKNNIRRANGRTNRASRVLDRLEKGFEKASKTTTIVWNKANKFFESINDILEKAVESETFTSHSKNGMATLKEELKRTEDQTSFYVEKIAKEKDLLATLTSKSIVAEKFGKKAYADLLNQSEVMDLIQPMLSENIEVSKEELDQLELELEKAEGIFIEHKFEEYIKEEKARQSVLSDQSKMLKKEVKLLKAELENLQNVRDSLPEKCFNLVKLEQQ